MAMSWDRKMFFPEELLKTRKNKQGVSRLLVTIFQKFKEEFRLSRLSQVMNIVVSITTFLGYLGEIESTGP